MPAVGSSSRSISGIERDRGRKFKRALAAIGQFHRGRTARTSVKADIGDQLA
jgi:hypothetical protein